MDLWSYQADIGRIIKPYIKHVVLDDKLYSFTPFQIVKEDIKDEIVSAIDIGDKDYIQKTWNCGSNIFYVLVSKKDETYIGCVAVDRFNMIPTISNVFVVERFRKQGFSKILLNYAEQFVFKELDFNQVTLWCDPIMMPFYEKRNYTKTDEIDGKMIMTLKRK